MNISTYEGTITITDIVDGEYIKHRYLGFTQKEAKRLFKRFKTDAQNLINIKKRLKNEN